MEKDNLNNKLYEEFPILIDPSKLNDIQCQYDQTGIYVCSKKKCQKSAVMCASQTCPCKENHKECHSTTFIKDFILKLKKKVVDPSSLIRENDKMVDQFIQKIRDQAVKIKQTFKTQVQAKAKALSFTESEQKMLRCFQKKQKAKLLKGNEFYQFNKMEQLNSKNYDLLNLERQIQIGKKIWKYFQSKVIQQFKLIEQNIKDKKNEELYKEFLRIKEGNDKDNYIYVIFQFEEVKIAKKTETEVDLSRTTIDGYQVRAICQLLPQLKYLSLDWCQHIKSIKLKSCQILQELSLSDAKNVTDIQLEQMPALKKLNLFQCSQLQSIKLVQLTQLEYLNLIGCSKIKEAIQLKNCKKIKELWLENVDQSHQNLVQLLSQQLDQLVSLSLSGWKQIQFSQLKFNNCKQLSGLYLGHTEITDGEVQGLGAQVPQLEILDLIGCKKIMNPSLNNFNKLKDIFLNDTSVSKEKVQELIKKHPNIKINY